MRLWAPGCWPALSGNDSRQQLGRNLKSMICLGDFSAYLFKGGRGLESSDSDQKEPTPLPRSSPQPLPRSCRLFSFFCPITPDKRREVLLPCFHHCTQDGGLSTVLWVPGIPGQVERASVGLVLGCLAPRPVLPSANTPLRAQCTRLPHTES